MSFAGKTVWITGASSGIGEHVAYQYDKEGANLILSARSESKLEAVKNNCSSGQGEKFVLPFDVGLVDEIDDITQKALALTGQIDVLINNAGISQRGRVEDGNLAIDRKIFEVNFFGNIQLTRSLLPHMLERSSGNLVIISSLAGKMSTPFRSAYAGSKHALHGWYDALRAELADRNIGVHIICPGYIRTNISVNALKSSGEQHGVMDPNQDAGMSPENCAKQIVKAISKNKREVYIGGKETSFLWIRKIFPSIYYKMVERMARSTSY